MTERKGWSEAWIYIAIAALLVAIWWRFRAPPPAPMCHVTVLRLVDDVRLCAAHWSGGSVSGPGAVVQDADGYVAEICTRAPVGTSLLTQCEWRR